MKSEIGTQRNTQAVGGNQDSVESQKPREECLREKSVMPHDTGQM